MCIRTLGVRKKDFMHPFQSNHSLLVLAFATGSHKATTLLGRGISGNVLTVKGFEPLPKGAQLRLQMCYWNGVVKADATVVKMVERNGAWHGFLTLNQPG